MPQSIIKQNAVENTISTPYKKTTLNKINLKTEK